MVKLIHTALFIGLLTFGTTAQAVFEESKNMSLGNQNALYVDVEGADKKIAEEAMEELIKEYGKWKKNRKAKEYYAEGISISPIAGRDPLDVYFKFDEMGNQTRAYMWIFDGEGFLNSAEAEEKISGAESIMQDYYVKAKRIVIQKEVDREEDLLKDEEKALNKLVKKNESLHKNIEKWKKEIRDREEKIAEAERDIEDNISDQEAKRGEIEQQEEVVRETMQKKNDVRKN